MKTSSISESLCTSMVDLVKGLNSRSCSEHYDLLDTLFKKDRVTFDNRLQGYIVGSYFLCSELLTCENRLSRDGSSASKYDGKHWHPEALQGRAILTNSLFFDSCSSSFHKRRKKLIECVARDSPTEKQLIELSSRLLQKVSTETQDSKADLYAVFREYNCRCALSLFGQKLCDKPCRHIQRDLLKAVFLLDSKVFSKDAVESGFRSIYRIADWLENRSRDELFDLELDADRTMLAITATESIAYLLFTYFSNQSYIRKNSQYTMNSVLDECLRYDSPIQMVRRVARIDFNIGDQKVLTGEPVYLHIGAANRDPKVFVDPCQFRPERDHRPLSFGLGRSSCPGAGFAYRCIRAFIDTADKKYDIDMKYSSSSFMHGLAGRGAVQSIGNIKCL